MVERLLTQPYVVIDLLPWQVPAGSEGQYFAVERYLRHGPQCRAIADRFVRLCLKLNCYYAMTLFRPDTEQTLPTPSPEDLANRLTDCLTGHAPGDLYLLLPGADAMLTLYFDDLYMTLYHPSTPLLELVRTLAASEDLFVWQPPGA